MVKRYLGAVLVAFVLGCVGPLTVGAAQAADEPDDAPSLLGSVTDTVGGVTSGDADAEPDVDASEAVPDGPEPAPEPAPEPGEPAPPGPEATEPETPGTDPAADGVGSGGPGVLGAVNTTVNRLADAPRSLLAGAAGGDTPPPDVPVQPDVPTPDVSEPPADTPASPNEPHEPGSPGKPETPDGPHVDSPGGPPSANAAPALPGVNENVTEPVQTEPAPANQSITQPDTAEPEHTESQRPRRDVPAFLDPTDSTGGNPTDQDKPAVEPHGELRADAISLKQVTQTPFILAIALLTAVGVVTVRRVITVK